MPYGGPLPWLCLRLQLQSPGRALPSLGLVPPPFSPARLSDRARGAELSEHSSHPYGGGEGWRERRVGPTAGNQTSECLPSFPGAYFRGLWSFSTRVTGICSTLLFLDGFRLTSSYCSASSWVSNLKNNFGVWVMVLFESQMNRLCPCHIGLSFSLLSLFSKAF